MKIDKKYSNILFAVFMTLGMSFAMSLTLTLINLGLVPNFLEKWLRAYAIGFAVSLPTSLAIIPIAKRTVKSLTD